MSSVIGELFDKFEQERPHLEQTVGQLKTELSSYSGIVLYGAGSSGIALLLALQRAGIYPLCFADGAPDKWGTECMGLEVDAPQELVGKYGPNILVIVCINTDGQTYCRSFAESLRQGGHSGVHRRLHDCGCGNVVDYISFRRCFALFSGDNTGNLPSCPDVDCLVDHRENIERVYERLADRKSQEIYTNILTFRLFGEGPEIETLPQEEKYFPLELGLLTEHEVFVDCGAFDGQTLHDLLEQTNGVLDSYYALEPDSESFERLKCCVSQMQEGLRNKIVCSPCAAWKNCRGTEFYSLHGPGSFVADYGGTKVQTVTIDRLLDGRRVTAIKMNIEGSELAALEGAKETVQRWHPNLIIAGYHKTWDFWEIPELMLKARYRVYLRSYMHHLSFVFYGI